MAASASLKFALAWAGRLLLGGSFAHAAALKLLDPAAFATDIGHHRLLPYPLTLALGVYLPWLELIGATAVLLRWRERGTLGLLIVLCVIFTLALASASPAPSARLKKPRPTRTYQNATHHRPYQRNTRSNCLPATPEFLRTKK